MRIKAKGLEAASGLPRNVVPIASPEVMAQRRHARAWRLLREELKEVYAQTRSESPALPEGETAAFWEAMAQGDSPAAVAILREARVRYGPDAAVRIFNREPLE